jgi:hypothetical protein
LPFLLKNNNFAIMQLKKKNQKYEEKLFDICMPLVFNALRLFETGRGVFGACNVGKLFGK